MKILGLEVRFDKDAPPERLMIVNPQFTQAVDVLNGLVYDFKKGKWKLRKAKLNREKRGKIKESKRPKERRGRE